MREARLPVLNIKHLTSEATFHACCSPDTMIAFHKARHRNDLIQVQEWVDGGHGRRTRLVHQQTPLVGPAWLRKLLGPAALVKTMDRQAAEWDAAAGAGVFTIQAFVALDGARMLPCATVEWRVTPLRGPGAPGTQVAARVVCWAERFAYMGLQGAIEGALLSLALAGTHAFNAFCQALFEEPAPRDVATVAPRAGAPELRAGGREGPGAVGRPDALAARACA